MNNSKRPQSTQTENSIPPMVFFNIGWMSHYQGQTGGDSIQSKGYFGESWAGHECYNFQPEDGRCYGFVVNQKYDNQLHVDTRLGAPAGADRMEGVLVVWTATHPEGGRTIVGWYDEATVYRHIQDFPDGTRRIHPGDGYSCPFRAEADWKHCYLVPEPRRTFALKHPFRYVWYAEGHVETKQAVLAWIDSERHVLKETRLSWYEILEEQHRQERQALQATTSLFEERGAEVTGLRKAAGHWILRMSQQANEVEVAVLLRTSLTEEEISGEKFPLPLREAQLSGFTVFSDDEKGSLLEEWRWDSRTSQWEKQS